MSDRRQSEDRFASLRHLALSGCGRIRPTYLAVMATLILCTLLPTAHADYSYHKQITIDHNKVSGSSNLSNFPVLISVIDGDLRTTANGGHVTSANGYDIVFGTLTGAQFDHEIEEYDGATGKLVAWVRAPTVYHNINTIIYMCYGDSSITSSQEDIAGVWDSNFVMVQHLRETSRTSGSYNDHLDSTLNDNDGEAENGVAMDTDGKISGADDFDGVDDYIRIPHKSSLSFSGNFTLEGWFYRREFFWGAPSTHVIAKGEQFVAGDYWMRIEGDRTIFDVMGVGDMGYGPYTAIPKESWTHIAAVFTRGQYSWGYHTMRIYINGQLDKEVNGMTGTPQTSTRPLYLGSYRGLSLFWKGKIDEVRLSKVARSVDWIKTSYNNQSDPSTFYTVGTEQSGCGGGGGGLAVELDSFTAAGADGEVTLNWSTASEIETVGFNVYRSDSHYGLFDRINGTLIPSRGASFGGASYTYTDYNVVNKETYYYMLEEIETDGETSLHGPVSAVPGVVSLLNPKDGEGLPLDEPDFRIAASRNVKRIVLCISSSPTLSGKGTIRVRVKRGESGVRLGRRARKRLAKLASRNGWTLYCGVFGCLRGERGSRLLSNVNRFNVLLSATAD